MGNALRQATLLACCVKEISRWPKSECVACVRYTGRISLCALLVSWYLEIFLLFISLECATASLILSSLSLLLFLRLWWKRWLSWVHSLHSMLHMYNEPCYLPGLLLHDTYGSEFPRERHFARRSQTDWHCVGCIGLIKGKFYGSSVCAFSFQNYRCVRWNLTTNDMQTAMVAIYLSWIIWRHITLFFYVSLCSFFSGPCITFPSACCSPFLPTSPNLLYVIRLFPWTWPSPLRVVFCPKGENSASERAYHCLSLSGFQNGLFVSYAMTAPAALMVLAGKSGV